MENKTPSQSKVKYTGRFADPTEVTARHSTLSVRPTPANADPGTRPTGFAAPEPQRRRPSPKPTAAQSPRTTKWGKRTNTKRAQRGKACSTWRRALLIALAVALVFLILLLLIFGGRGGTYHQLPRVERTGTATQAPVEADPLAEEAAA